MVNRSRNAREIYLSSPHEMLPDVTDDPAPCSRGRAPRHRAARRARGRAPSSSIAWVRSGAEIYRTRKPDVPPKHLVAYFAVVDVDADRILLVDHIIAGLWLPAGGHVEPGEDPRATVTCELAEELAATADLVAGLSSNPLFVTQTTTVGSDAGHVDVSLWYVVAASIDDRFEPDPREFRDIRWWSFDEIGTRSTGDARPAPPPLRHQAAARPRRRRRALGRAFVDVPLLAAVAQAVEERHGVERLRAEHAGALPHARRQQLQRDDRVDRGLPHDGLRAVARHRLRVVGHVVQVHLARLAVDAGAGHPRSRARAAVHAVAERRGIRAAPPRRHRAATPRRRARAPAWSTPSPSCASVCSTSMNSSPSPYLNDTRRQSTAFGISSTSSCSTCTHSIGPMPSGNTNVSGSENGASREEPAVALPHERRVEALLDRRPDRERRREVVAVDHEVGAVAHADLVDLGEQVVGGVAGEDVGEAGLHAHAHEREQPPLAANGRTPPNCSSPSITPGSS